VRFSWTETVPFGKGSDGTYRPYLWLTLHGPEDGPELLIPGLVDTGADKTVLPVDYAELLGYDESQLEEAEVGQVEGLADGLDALAASSASVFGLEDVTFEIEPVFVDTLDPLWGRADLMKAYTISISERREELGLHLP
jgi:hypothetical protein